MQGGIGLGRTHHPAGPVLGQASLDLHVVKDGLVVQLMRTDAIDCQAVVSVEVKEGDLLGSAHKVKRCRLIERDDHQKPNESLTVVLVLVQLVS